jgi:hypothetical protein
LVTFLSGSAVGGIATAAFQASHQHAERIRDRMLATAEAFIVKAEEAMASVRNHDMLTTDVLTARDAMFEALRDVAEVFGSDEDIPLALQRAPDLLQAVEDVWGDEGRERVEALRELIDQTRTELRDYRANFADDPRKAKAVADALDTTSRFAVAMSRYFGMARESLEGTHALVTQLARVQLVFGAQKDNVTASAIDVAKMVAEEASFVAGRYGASATTVTAFIRELSVASEPDHAHEVSAEDGEEPDSKNSDPKSQASDLPSALVRFATSANGRVRSWWWQL